MRSRGLLKPIAPPWGAGPANAASSLILPRCTRRLCSMVRTNSTYLNSLHKPPISTIWLIRGSSRTTQHPAARTISTNPRPGKPTRPRLLYILALLALALPTLNQLRSSPDPRTTLNKDLFTPCTVVSHQALSPTAFLLTIQLPADSLAAAAAAWRHGLWSVEVKQPQLQIARHYTPLPGAAAAGQLRLYVRRYGGGEMSTYLSRLRAGDVVEIRGPHLGFDLGVRLGDTVAAAGASEGGEETKTKVVVLAGGTGLAPALQVAEWALGREGVEVQILWANRSGVDCAACQRLPVESRGWFSRGAAVLDERHGKEEPSALGRQIRELQAAYERQGRKLDVKCAVDEEGSVVKARDIMNAVGKSEQVQDLSSLSCHFHSQQRLEYSTQESDASDGGQDGAKESVAARHCTCVGMGGKGKNLFIVSGPDGFVSAFVGPKIWADGGERQGSVGGMVSELMKEQPENWKNWLILKQ